MQFEYEPLLSVAQVSIASAAVTATDFASASLPLLRWFRNEGMAIAARMPMIRMTTRSSIRVKPLSLLGTLAELPQHVELLLLGAVLRTVARARASVRGGNLKLGLRCPQTWRPPPPLLRERGRTPSLNLTQWLSTPLRVSLGMGIPGFGRARPATANVPGNLPGSRRDSKPPGSQPPAVRRPAKPAGLHHHSHFLAGARVALLASEHLDFGLALRPSQRRPERRVGVEYVLDLPRRAHDRNGPAPPRSPGSARIPAARGRAALSACVSGAADGRRSSG